MIGALIVGLLFFVAVGVWTAAWHLSELAHTIGRIYTLLSVTIERAHVVSAVSAELDAMNAAAFVKEMSK